MTDFAALEEFLRKKNIYFSRDVSLRGLCTFKIGGNASIVIEPSSKEQISLLAGFMQARKLSYVILGKGSNVLFPDEGLDRAVILLGEKFSQVRPVDEDCIFCCSGLKLTALCRFALERGLSGLEFAYGIPGTVGGAVYMNAGAYGGEMKDVLTETFHINPDGSPGSFCGGEMDLAYRESAYTNSDKIITEVLLKLKKDDKEEIRAKMDDFMSRRRDKQPLEYPSAGSTFRRPAGAYASALIDQCGLKGFTVGGAQVSEKHAGFVINRGGAVCADVMAVIAAVQCTVKEKTGYGLEPEIKLFG